MTDSSEIVALQLERDICSLFHRSARAKGTPDTGEFAALYSLPYWDYLDMRELEPARAAFIRRGCLMLILRLTREYLWGDASSFGETLLTCRSAVAALEPEQDRDRELCQITLLMLDEAAQGRGVTDSVFHQMNLVEDDILLDYFKGMARWVSNAGLAETAGQVSLARYEAQADEAFRRLYEAGSGTEAAAWYNESKESLAEAIALARAMELPEATASLERKLEQCRSIFRAQFS